MPGIALGSALRLSWTIYPLRLARPADGSGSVYYRIQGPRLPIEFSTQGDLGTDARHYHSIYRNPAREYGGTMPAAR